MALFEKEMVVVDDDSANRLSSFHSDVLVNAPVLLMMTSPPPDDDRVFVYGSDPVPNVVCIIKRMAMDRSFPKSRPY